jgi:predicted GNAT family acetyltransferase
LSHGRKPEGSRAASRKRNPRVHRLRSRQNRSRSSGRQNVRPSIEAIMSTVTHEQSAHRFTVEAEGQLAVLDYTITGSVMTITHTGVPQAIRGRGIAAELMRAALRAAGAAGWTVNPACSYAAAYMRRNPGNLEQQHLDELLDEALEESFPASDSPSVGGSD